MTSSTPAEGVSFRMDCTAFSEAALPNPSIVRAAVASVRVSSVPAAMVCAGEILDEAILKLVKRQEEKT